MARATAPMTDRINVDFPASDPYALACGGTSVQASGNSITSETVWNDGAQGGATGGGISTFFPVPPYQEGLSAALTAGGTRPLTNRGVPDVAGDADENTGYDVRVDGSDTVIGGTSAVAPLWAGLIARINSANGKSGRLRQSDAVQESSRFQRHHPGKQRRLRGAQGLGRLHRNGKSRRDQDCCGSRKHPRER